MRRKIFSIWSVVLVLVISLAVFVPGCEGEIPLGTIEVTATLDGSPWTGDVDYTLTPATGSPFAGTSVDKTFIEDPDDWTCAHISGGPGTFVSITPAETQNLAAGDTITFTLNFVTPATEVDAYITFDTWTINGTPVAPGFHLVGPGTVVDARYKEGVTGNNTGQEVTVKETLWLQYHWQGQEGSEAPPKMLHVVNAPGAVWGVPPFEQKLSQTATFNGQPVTPCSRVECPWCQIVNLDVEIETVQKVGTIYTKNVNWIRFNPGGGVPMILQSLDEVVFEDDNLLDWQQFTATTYACIEVGEGFVDTNPNNDCCVDSPSITIIYQPPLPVP